MTTASQTSRINRHPRLLDICQEEIHNSPFAQSVLLSWAAQQHHAICLCFVFGLFCFHLKSPRCDQKNASILVSMHVFCLPTDGTVRKTTSLQSTSSDNRLLSSSLCHCHFMMLWKPKVKGIEFQLQEAISSYFLPATFNKAGSSCMKCHVTTVSPKTRKCQISNGNHS